ncbi:MAG: DUF1080 domain-containing protein [Candidatus Solibacter usitatus]|nr:DUF1080 domain-containing protein [Candidatus Solibacter usitatus]
MHLFPRALLSLSLLPALLCAEAVTPKKKVRLFNGRDLTNFYVFLKDSKREDPKKVFTVAGKQIRISGEEWGGLTTVNEYRDYRLIVEWKWGVKTWAPRVDRARDSGILLHGTGVDGAAGSGWLESIEYQMIEGGTGDLLLVKGANKPRITVDAETGPDKQLYWKKGAARVTRDAGRVNWYGRDVNWKDQKGYRGPKDVEKPLGQWNRSEVVAEGGNLTYYVNGVMVNQGFEGDHASGKIQIQSEAAEVFIRKIELRPVEKHR